MATDQQPIFINLGDVEINLSLVTHVQWDFAGHDGSAMVTFVDGGFRWIHDPVWAGELRGALRLLGRTEGE